LPIHGAKAKLAQTYGAFKIAEIDIPEVAPEPKGHPALWAGVKSSGVALEGG
jgi:hypothetical protein